MDPILIPFSDDVLILAPLAGNLDLLAGDVAAPSDDAADTPTIVEN